MKRYKGVIIFIIIALIYTGIMVLLFYKKGQPEDNPGNTPGQVKPQIDPDSKDNEYLVVDNTSIWLFSNGNWVSVNKKAVDNKKMIIYVDNNKIGSYYLKSGNVWNLFDDNSKFVNYDGALLAHSDNMKINIKSLTEIEIDSSVINDISKILNKEVDFDDIAMSVAYETKINNNDFIDKIIYVSNIENDVEKPFYYNVIYADIDGHIIPIINEEIQIKDLLVSPRYFIDYVIDIDDSDYSNIIINRKFYSNTGNTGNILFSYDNDSYKISVQDKK